MRDRPNAIVATPKPITASSKSRPGPLHGRPMRHDQGHHQGSDGRGAAEPAQPHGADLQDVLGEDRQERDGAAEQHGEHVERDGGQDEARIPHVAEPGQERMPRVIGSDSFFT